MKRYLRATLMPLLAALSIVAWAAQDKAIISYKAQAGQSGRYKSTGTLNFDAMGSKVTMDLNEIEKITFTAVAANGDITVERETESSEVTVNGQKLPDDDDKKDKSTTVFKADGTLVSYKSTSDMEEQTKTAIRLFQATNVVFPATGIGVGDKWSREFKADTAIGTHSGKADFEVIAAEKAAGVDTLKIKMTYKESDSSPQLGATGNLWVEKTSGDSVVSEYEVENIPLGPAMASGKIKQERISGGPMPGGKPAEVKPGDTKPEPKKEKTIDETVKDFEKVPGIVTLYRKKDSGRETIYMELREDQLDQLMMLQCTAATGNGEQIIAGDPINDLVFKFSKSGDERILMVVPNMNFRATAGTPLSRSVKRAFADAYLDAYKVEAKQLERKSLLLNVSDLFRGDVSQISQIMGGGGGILGGAGGGFSMDRDKTYIASIKNFPDNLVVETQYNFTRGARGGGGIFGGLSALADTRSSPIRVNYNLFALTDTGYRPRLADPRAGFFYTEYQDFSDDAKDDQTVRYILRWDVRKADPKAAMSAPVKPITFWLDNAIPLEYRDAVKDGILWWNRAFEKVGIKEAIVVKQMPDNADFDHADMRYNVIRWSTTQSPPYGAIALFRVNPMTGQILNAGITVDAILGRSGKIEYKRAVEPATAFAQRLNSAFDPKKFNPARCEFAHGSLLNAWFGQMAIEATHVAGNKVSPLVYTNDFIRSIVAHEMGHIMGLWHNFVASTQHSLAELKDPKIAAAGITGSVMDYFPFNVSALKQKKGVFYPKDLGAYDYWVIQYGYTPIEAATPNGELHKLKQIASKSGLPGHAFQNDFYADSFDPNISRGDLGSDPLAYSQKMMELSRYLILTNGARYPKKGESYWDFTRTLFGMLQVYSSSAADVTRYIGGIHLNRNHKGDAREKPVMQPVDGAKQRKALDILNRYVFSETAFTFPKSYFGKLTTNPFPNLSSFTLGSGGDYPIRDSIANAQRQALAVVFSGSTIGRVVNNEFKASDPSKALKLTTLFGTIGSAVWSELDSGKAVNSVRRQLQRSHLETMVSMLVRSGAPEDARMLAWDQLGTLKTKLTAAKTRNLDDYTRIHVAESLMRVNRALNASLTISGPSASGPSLLQQLLGGAEQPDKR